MRKGAQDRVTMLPQSLEEALQRQLARTKLVHEEDLAAGYGEVYLPYAFARKDPHAGTSWEWQYVFPASKRSIDPRDGVCTMGLAPYGAKARLHVDGACALPIQRDEPQGPD